MMYYHKTLIILFIAIFACNVKIYCQSQHETVSSQDSTRQTISFGLSDLLEVGYRRSFSDNLDWGVTVLLNHEYSDESGDISWSRKDRNIQNNFTLGIKLQMIYSTNIYGPIYLNVGGGVIFKSLSFYQNAKNEVTQEYDYERKEIRRLYGFSFMTGIEIKIYKQFRITGQFNIFAGYRVYEDGRNPRRDYSMLEVENMLIGGIVYF